MSEVNYKHFVMPKEKMELLFGGLVAVYQSEHSDMEKEFIRSKVEDIYTFYRIKNELSFYDLPDDIINVIMSKNFCLDNICTT